MQACSGDCPHPREACALAIQNGHAYLLTADLVNDVGLIIYELDLETWHWRRLPAAPTQFFWESGYGLVDTVAASVVKVCSCTQLSAAVLTLAILYSLHTSSCISCSAA